MRPSTSTPFSLSPDQEGALRTFLAPIWPSQCLFLTGRAGTGKSTVLRRFVEETDSNVVVLAPTGLAAINAGGQTIHSFFRIKPGPLELDDPEVPQFRPGHPIRKVIEEAHVVVLDEISMVRADLLDAIDLALRRNSKQSKEPFAGKRILFVGDLWQLPPVVSTPAEQEMLDSRYGSEFFFDSLVAQRAPMLAIELATIHRQASDPAFMDALNLLRSGDPESLPLFNERVIFGGGPPEVLRLTATRARAAWINSQRLSEIAGPAKVYSADIMGTLREEELPAERLLNLKVGARVMFTRNGTEWVNGSLGEVTGLGEGTVQVRLDDGATVEAEPVTWEKRSYRWDPSERRIGSEIVGSATQIPLRLAYAVTIHKAQGLTFDKVHVDFDRRAFGHGHAYVALSRCRSLAGMTLERRLTEAELQTSERVRSFARGIGL